MSYQKQNEEEIIITVRQLANDIAEEEQVLKSLSLMNTKTDPEEAKQQRVEYIQQIARLAGAKAKLTSFLHTL